MVTSKRKSPQTNDASKKVKTTYLEEHDELAINTIRCLGADMPERAKSGHPGAPMGCAPIAHALFAYAMRYDASHKDWINRDRFVLSNGHACALLYAMLHLSGYDITKEDLMNFRQLHSKTPGHPEVVETPGVEVTTGPLGQGISNAVGLAIAAHHLAAKYNEKDMEIFSNNIFVICGDGCLQEGLSSEACSLAGHLGLGKLIVLYDSNNITIDGITDLSFTEDVLQRYKSYGWHTLNVKDGDHDVKAIVKAIEDAKSVLDKPSLIKIHTTIGFGSSKEGSEKVHGSPLGEEDLKQLKAKFDLDPEKSFQIPDAVKHMYDNIQKKNQKEFLQWQDLLKKYEETYPSKAQELQKVFGPSSFSGVREKKIREKVSNIQDIKQSLEKMAEEFHQKPDSTRSLSGKALNVIRHHLPQLIGGSADLTGSNSSALVGEKDIQSGSMEERYIHFGVREHGMAAITNGIFAFGGLLPFCATFLNFITYAWGSVRISALSKFGCLYIMTHDSIELGEDGPTHQPVEVLPLLRATPNMQEIRPADSREVAGAYLQWLMHPTRPTVLCLCRGGIPPLAESAIDGVSKGAYVLHDFEDNGGKKILIAGCGTELHMCVDAAEELRKHNFDVRVVSMPSWTLFEEQSDEYKEKVLCKQYRREGACQTVYVEAAVTFGWDRYFDIHIGMNSFGMSAPKADCYRYFGFTKEKIVAKILGNFREDAHALKVEQTNVKEVFNQSESNFVSKSHGASGILKASEEPVEMKENSTLASTASASA